MTFYGKKHDYDPQIRELEERLEVAAARAASTQYTDIKLPKQINLNTIGSTILQAIFSGQYVLGCITAYFEREWIKPATHYLQPHFQAYSSAPYALTKLK